MLAPVCTMILVALMDVYSYVHSIDVLNRNHNACSYFSAITCPDLTPPSNGRVTPFGNTAGSLALYQCNDGYEIASGFSTTRTCGDDGEWSGSAPTCISAGM